MKAGLDKAVFTESCFFLIPKHVEMASGDFGNLRQRIPITAPKVKQIS